MTKNKIYNISTPTDEDGKGDYDYITKLTYGLNSLDKNAQCLTLKDIISDDKEQEKVRQGVRNIKSYKDFESNYFNEKYDIWSKNLDRKSYIEKIKGYILQEVKNYKYIAIINLQLRAPETGFVFMPEDIRAFKEAGIKFNITCHEYKLDAYSRVAYQAVLHPYFQAADTVSFFNLKDLSNACKHANHTSLTFKMLSDKKQKEWKALGDEKFEEWRKQFKHEAYDLADKVILTRVPPTVDYKIPRFDDFNAREPNIIIFGQIRGNKGFEIIIELAKEIKLKKVEGRIIIAGNVKDGNLMFEILCEKYGKREVLDFVKKFTGGNNTKTQYDNKIFKKGKIKDFVNTLFKEGCEEKAPIDLYISPSGEEVKNIFNKAKYAIKFDNKGWANNASGHINALANGCIIITGWGMATPKEVLKDGKYEGAIVLLGNKYGLKAGMKLPLEQERTGGKQKFVTIEDSDKNTFNGKESVKDPITIDRILQELILREKDPCLNQKTFEKAQKLMIEFNEKTVAKNFYINLINENARKAQEETKEKLNELELNYKEAKGYKNISSNEAFIGKKDPQDKANINLHLNSKEKKPYNSKDEESDEDSLADNIVTFINDGHGAIDNADTLIGDNSSNILTLLE